MDRAYTVYCHISPSGKRYIGITCQVPKRRWDTGRAYSYARNAYFNSAIKKYGWDSFEHVILFTGLTREQAEQKEIELIAHYQSNNRLYGYNIANGGNCTGTVSEETKQKLSEAFKGENHWMYGKSHTDETKKRLSEALKGHVNSEETRKKISEVLRSKDRSGVNSPSYGRPVSQETRLKISKSLKGTKASLETRKILSEMRTGAKHPSAKVVMQFDMDGNYIRTWDYMSQLTKEFGYATANLSKACKGTRKSAYGYKWAYAENIEGISDGYKSPA